MSTTTTVLPSHQPVARPAGAGRSEPRGRHGLAGVAGMALAAAWLGYLLKLRLNWDPAGYYAFGWAVVPLTGFLAWVRVQDLRPRPLVPGPRWTLAAAALLLLAAAPLRVAMELNAFWRLPLWGAGLCLVAATSLTVWHCGGARMARAMAFPCGALLLMIPWPAQLEQRLIDTLTGAITATNVEILQLAGFPAEAQGHVIAMGATSVGVDDACSGIRSLQLLFALAVFVGAFWPMTWRRRLVLPLLAIGVAFIGNVARSIALSLGMFQGGQSTYAAWHDPAGYISMTASAAILLGLAMAWSRRAIARTDAPANAAPQIRASWGWTIIFVVCCLLPETAAWAWFTQPKVAASQHDIVVRWPEHDAVRAETLPMDERVREILGFDYGAHVRLFRYGTPRGDAWHYGFTARSGSKSIAAYIHQPTICMTAAGAQLVTTHEAVTVDLGPFELPFQHYTFRLPAASGGPLTQVYWCVWDDLAGAASASDGFRSASLHALRTRSRSLERQVLLISIPDSDPQRARTDLRETVRAAVTPVVDGQEVSFQ